ncbi:Ger(x)C family spore germination protein [Virgibacillus sp. LDC-1]|uniref:Ger(x)C family spore germination protein n=1 Tax=Virgibacillus sp. LDC-1 TaxID=3039856 RepID=UPI0024DE0298|nr:Ger(x)C family spore germination protein [Virgibacillus sp. LDC-1]
MKRLTRVIVFLLCIVLLAGCWDQKQVEKHAYVFAIGLDKGEENDPIEVTYIIVNPDYGSQQQGGGANEPAFETITFPANDIISAKDTANVIVAKEITYDIARLVSVSEDFAKEPDFIRWMYDLTKDPEIRRDLQLLVTKEKTSDFLKNNKPVLETRPHEYYKQALERGKETSMIPFSDLLTFFRITETGEDLYLSMYGTLEKTPTTNESTDNFKAGELKASGISGQAQFAGSAVFMQGKMIGTLTAEETRLAYLLNNTLNPQGMVMTFQDPKHEKYKVAGRVSLDSPAKVKLSIRDNKSPKINVHIPLNIKIFTNHSMVNYTKDYSKKEILKKSIEKELEQKMNTLVEKTKQEYKAQPFGWSLTARKKFSTIPEFNSYNWLKKYPDAEVSISVNVRLGQFGRQSEVPKMKELRK